MKKLSPDKFTVSIDHLSKEFKGHYAVNDFSIEITEGECIGLIGPNGAGKTTLLRMISDILEPTKGKVLFNGEDISKQKHLIGYLPQYPSFYDWMNAEDVLKFNATLSGMKKSEIPEAIEQSLNLVGLRDVGKKRVNDFSGGMKQRLGIAQAIIHKPKFVIMDEPVSALDPIGRREVLDLINIIKKDTTILFSTHILNDAQEVCDRFCVIKKGEKIRDFSIQELNTKSSNLVSIQLAQKNPDWIEYLKTSSQIKKVKERGLDIVINVGNVENYQEYIFSSILEYGVKVASIQNAAANSLEEYFLELVGEKVE
ncbi:ABC transporter ATP-binding protein [Peribacillus butanolivorans]|uniref:ABC transporter ATP-binding protein n=1 Tax=Peribacillus butanolivorans TaxID=421767 RepID=UPI0036DEA981